MDAGRRGGSKAASHLDVVIALLVFIHGVAGAVESRRFRSRPAFLARRTTGRKASQVGAGSGVVAGLAVFGGIPARLFDPEAVALVGVARGVEDAIVGRARDLDPVFIQTKFGI